MSDFKFINIDSINNNRLAPVPIAGFDGDKQFHYADVNPSGKLAISSDDPTWKYKFSDMTAAGDPQYFGYVDKDENWYIMKLTSTGATYAKGSGSYAVNFANAAILTYDYFFNLTW